LFLLQLQQADIKVRELESAVSQVPTKLEPLRRDLAKLQTMLDAESQKVSDTNSWRKQQQDAIDRERDALKAAQNKLQASKNSKEYGAASREVENKRKSISDRESELKKVGDVSTTSSAQLESRNKDVESLRSELAASEATQAQQIAQLEADLAAARATRDAARASVDKQWLKIYDSVAGKRGYGIAPVVKGVCQGCHMALPPQLNNVLARMESIETCPRCSRLVYRKELLEPKPEGGGAGAPPAGGEPKPQS
jgi:predicted  nucleic acid-binding Zn-ribbon protein